VEAAQARQRIWDCNLENPFSEKPATVPIRDAREVTKVTASGKVHVRVSAPMTGRFSVQAVVGFWPRFMPVSAYSEEPGQVVRLYLWS